MSGKSIFGEGIVTRDGVVIVLAPRLVSILGLSSSNRIEVTAQLQIKYIHLLMSVAYNANSSSGLFIQESMEFT